MSRWIEDLESRFRAWSAKNPEQTFLLRSGAVGAVIVAAQSLLGWYGFTWFLTLFFCLYLTVEALDSGKGYMRTLWENLTVFTVPRGKSQDRRREIPGVTIALILVNAALFFGPQAEYAQFFQDNLFWLPGNPSAWNVPASLVASLFLHGSRSHLVGNMAFLWVMGSIVERRVGARRFAALYLAGGVAGNLAALAVYGGVLHQPYHSLGASGSVAGIMGVYCVRCYFKEMVFPVPLFGVLPVAMRIRLNAVAVIGLFFALDLQRGVGEIAGTPIRFAHWAHLGGMLAGFALAYRLGLHRQAVEERHVAIGESVLDGAALSWDALNGGIGLDDAERSLRQVLAANPENTEALVHLARVLSLSGATCDCGRVYRDAITRLALTAPDDAARLYEEYFLKCHASLEPPLQLLISTRLHRLGRLDAAARGLELALDDGDLQPALEEKILTEAALILDDMGLHESAGRHWRRLAETYPESPSAERARWRLERARGRDWTV